MVVDAQQVKHIFLEALQLDSDSERRAFVEVACGADAALKGEVETMLAHEAVLGSFLGEGAGGEPHGIDTMTGTRVGNYELREEIGEGGFGVVYRAEQVEPVRREVAVKVLKAGMDTREVVSRFEAERQALALMDHPGIARVFDGGATSSGRPYFVMELVRGESINAYCDRVRLSLPRRLELFAGVCRAVQHAHQKGVIHRDLKPSNVLVAEVDGSAVPKVIDFGIAKALGKSLTDQTLATRIGHVIGTPQYMSPEQADLSTLDIDTRSDVYSLGVLLYELLTGTTPFTPQQLREATFDELRRMIRVEEPPRPSARLTAMNGQGADVASRRSTGLRRLLRGVQGELDWIVMKALEKEPGRRYQTANELAEDVGRYLADEPVEAGPPSAWYRVRKFARRHRIGVGAAALLSVLVVLGVAVAGWVASDRAARRAALDVAIEASLEEASSALEARRLPQALAAVERSEGLVAGGRPSGALVGEVHRWRADLDMLARLERIQLQLAEYSLLPDGSRKLPEFDSARVTPMYEPAFRRYGLPLRDGPIEEVVRGVRSSRIRDPLVVALMYWLMYLPRDDVLKDRIDRILSGTDDDPWRSRFRAAFRREDGDELMELLEDPAARAQPPVVLVPIIGILKPTPPIDLLLELLGPAWLRTPGDFWLNLTLGGLLLEDRPEAGIGFYRAALAARPRTPSAYVSIANAYAEMRLYEAAEANYQAALRIDPEDVSALFNIGVMYDECGRLDLAEPALLHALKIAPRWARAQANLGSLYARTGRMPMALERLRLAVQLDPEDPLALSNLGNAYREQGDPKAALPLLEKAVQVDPGYAKGWTNLGIARVETGDRDGAQKAYEESIRLAPELPNAYNNLGNLLLLVGKPKPAIAQFEQAIRIAPGYANAHLNLGQAHEADGDLEAAERVYRKGLALGPGAEAFGPRFHMQLGTVLYRMGRAEEGAEHWRASLDAEPMGGANHNAIAWWLATTPDEALRDPQRAVALAEEAVKLSPGEGTYHNTLGVARYRTGAFAKAIEALEASVRLRSGGDPYDWLFLAMAHARLGHRDEARREYDRAARWMAEKAPANPELAAMRAEADAVMKALE